MTDEYDHSASWTEGITFISPCPGCSQDVTWVNSILVTRNTRGFLKHEPQPTQVRCTC